MSSDLGWVELSAGGGPAVPVSGSAPLASAGAGSPALNPYPLKAQRLVRLVWLLVTDVATLFAAYGAAYWIRFDLQLTVAPEIAGSRADYLMFGVLVTGVWLSMFAAFGLYRPQTASGTVESGRIFNACGMAATIVVVGTFLMPTLVISRVWLISAWVGSFVGVSVSRFVTRRLVRALRRRGYLLAPAVIVGTNEEATSLAVFLSDWPSSGIRALGFVSTDATPGSRGAGLPTLGTADAIAAIVRQHQIEEVIVAITSVSREELLRLCEDVDTLPVALRLSSGLYEMLTTRVSVQTLGTVPLMSLQKNRLGPGEAAVKASIETSLAFLGLLVLSPLMLAVAVAIKLDSAGPIIYRRRVLGAGGRQFDAFKFRTMVVNGEDLLSRRPGAADELAANHKLKDDPRITALGRWLRKFSVDELPQLINVLLGQMALVGPRMITVAEAEKYGRHRMNLLAVKPGITGLWQVSGRSDISYEERVRFDMYYVRHYSIWLDLRILFVETLPAVLRSRGAY